MTTFFAEIMSTILRPSLAAITIAGAATIVTFDANPSAVSMKQVDVTDLSCSGLFRPVCRAFGG